MKGVEVRVRGERGCRGEVSAEVREEDEGCRGEGEG